MGRKQGEEETLKSTLASLCSVELAVKRSYESERSLNSAVMFWLESDSGKTLHRSAWLGSIVSLGSMKIDFLSHSEWATGRLPWVPLDALQSSEA